MRINTYLINLDGSNERLRTASSQLDSRNIKFIRVPAYDGRGIDPLTITQYNEPKALVYMGRKLNGGEIGCYFSHFNCAQRFLDSDADYAVVLEDDMQLNAGAFEIISKALSWLEANKLNWHLMNIGAPNQKIFSPIQTFSNHTLVHAHYFPMSAIGLIWSRAGALDFIENGKEIFAPVDNYYRYWLINNNKGLSIYPPLLTHGGTQSDIDNGKVKRNTTGRHWLYGAIKQKRLWTDKFKAIANKLKKPLANL